MSDLRDEIAAAIQREYDLADPTGEGYYPAPEALAPTVLAVVQKRAEQLAQELDDEADNAARMANGELDGVADASWRAESTTSRDNARRLRSVFGLATREETNQ